MKIVRSLLSRRDMMLVEKRIGECRRRAVRYAIFFLAYRVPNGTPNTAGLQHFYQYFVPNGTDIKIKNAFLKIKSHIFDISPYGTECYSQDLLFTNIMSRWDNSQTRKNHYMLFIFHSLANYFKV